MQLFQAVLVEGWRKVPRHWSVILPLYLTSLLLGLVQTWPLLANRNQALYNPFLGELSHEDWIKLNLRHAELHFSFFHPA